MMLAEWYGNMINIFDATSVPYGYIHYLYYKMEEEAKDKYERERRQNLNMANAMSGGRGRRAM